VVETVEASERRMPRGMQVSGGLVGQRETRLASSGAGRVVRAAVERGDTVKAGQVLVELEVAVPEAQLGSLPEGARFEFRTAAYPRRAFHGTLRGRGSRVRAASRDVVVDADVENPDRSLLPGMFVTVELPLTPALAVSLPAEALFERDGRWRALELREGRLREHVVQVGAEHEGFRAVLQGLSAGMQLVRRPAGLRNGQAATRGGG